MIKSFRNNSLFSSGPVNLLALLMISLSLFLFVQRFSSVLSDSELSVTTGVEGPGLYGITRVVMGDPVYQDLMENPSSMIFNFGFYYSYGLINKILGAEINDIPLYSRLITFFGALVLFGLIYFKLLNEFKVHGVHVSSFLVFLSVLTGPFIGWWILTARPDMIGIGFELLGFLYLMSFFHTGSRIRSYYLALFLFFAAWAFKQTLILGFPVALVLAFYNRKFTHLWIGGGLSLVLLSTPFLVFGDVYITNTLSLPAVNPFSVEQLFYVLSETVKTGFYIYIPAFFLIMYLFVSRKARWIKSHEFFLVALLLLSLIWSMITASRSGSYRNYFFLSYFLSGILILRLIFLNGLSVPALVKHLSFGLVVFFFTVLVSVYLIPNQNLSGRLSIVTPAERSEINSLRQDIQSGKGSFFVEFEFFALPSFTGVYPSIVIDPALFPQAIYYKLARSIGTRIQNHEFERLYINHPYLIEQAGLAGYKVTGQFNLLTKMELHEH